MYNSIARSKLRLWYAVFPKAFRDEASFMRSCDSDVDDCLMKWRSDEPLRVARVSVPWSI